MHISIPRRLPLVLGSAALLATGGVGGAALGGVSDAAAKKPKTSKRSGTTAKDCANWGPFGGMGNAGDMQKFFDLFTKVRDAVAKAGNTGADRVAAAKPILDDAVTAGTITQAMEDAILKRIEAGFPSGGGPGFGGFGPGGFGPSGAGGYGGFGGFGPGGWMHP